MARFAPFVPRRSLFVVCLAALIFATTRGSLAQSPQQPIVDPNVNMVRGITLPDGDPYLQRQNEPSIAVSTRNPCHLVAGANDYRTVDIPFDDTPPPNADINNISLAGDAWLGLFKSFDCGQKWQSTMLPGFPQDESGKAPILKGYEAGADPTVRAGSNGLFYYSGMVFNRGTQGDSRIFVARLVDNNNKERGDPIEFLDVATVDVGTKGQFLDKPWLAVDVPRASFGPGSTLATGVGNATGTCTVNNQQVPAGNVYMAWARFTGNADQHAKLMFARSTDCGKTWTTHPISNNQSISQGANIAIAPHDGTVYLTWREFAGGNKPVNMWVAVSSDGGKNFSNPKMIAADVKTFDQLKSNTKFRSNALPAIVADHQDRVYIGWAATGYGWTYDANGVQVPNTDARIVMTVSSDRGQTFSPVFPIDPIARRGHQMMPSLTFAAGKIQGIYYDAREDVSGVFTDFIDDKDVAKLRHTIDVRGVQADPAAQPVFVSSGLDSLEISKYRRWKVGGVSTEIGANPPNLPMYAAGSMPFMGDYIDVSGLSSFPIQTSNGQQVWQPNIGPVNLMGASALTTSTMGFPTLPIFHAAWTDNRDVRAVGAQCEVPPDPSATGERNANIYTSRLTPGLFVGSPGNTKPLGFRLDPVTKQPTTELIQRGFVVFAQNTTDKAATYRFTIVNQPPGGRASFRQFDKPANQTPNGPPSPGAPLTQITVGIPKGSTAARTVYATSTDAVAQILVNIEELPPPSGGGGSSTPPPGWSPLRGSILLNPDRTNPKILDPDLDEFDPLVPQIASDEIHDPSMFEAQFFKHKAGVGSRMLDVKNPDPENPDPENPDPENPDPENPDPENPDPENPDPENPDPENPDPENPDPENPDPENVGVLNTALSDAEVQNSTITDVNWRVHNSGNTTSAYRFRPSVAKHVTGQKYQLIVTRRYMTLAMDPKTCKPIYKSQNQVIVSIENFQPRTPDPENPDPENPDPENPDPENPDPENPDPENANFFLQPDETATVTLRVFTPPGEEVPDTEEEVAGKTAAKAANTGEEIPATAVTGPDLTLSEPLPTFAPAVVRPAQTVNVSWTLTNRGTAGATSPSGTIKTNVYFSFDNVLSVDDVKIGVTIELPASLAVPLPHCTATGDPDVCRRPFTTPVVMPAAPGQYYVIIVTDDDNDANDEGGQTSDPDDEVFEADELNNVVVVPISVAAFQLAFVQQPSATTQDFTMAPPVVVAVTHPDGGAVTAAEVAFVTLAIQNNPAVPAGVLSGTLVQPNLGGVASFSDLQIGGPASGYTLAATAALSTAAISSAFTIEVDAPPVTANDSYTVAEDQTLNVAAPGVLTNDSDPPTKGIKPASYNFDAVVATGPSNGALTLELDGSFTYTPNAAFAGVDTFTYRARDGRAGNETTGTVTITVTSLNDAPSFTKGPDQTVAEDSGAQSVSGWATAISAGPANESTQTVDFLVSNDNNALFSSQPAVSPNGTLMFTPAANANGTAVVTVRAHDNGGTAGGGVDTSAPQTFTITVTAVNDPPSFIKGADQTVAEDAGAQTVPNWATAISAGPANEAGQVLTFLVTNTNNALFSAQPSIAANGTLSYTTAANVSGSATVTVQLQDNGGGADTSAPQTFVITVSAVNDPPSFTKGADQTVSEDTPAQTVPNWATAISAGNNEAGQVVDFLVTNDNTTLFSAQPAVAADGTLTYTPAANRNGVATVTVRAHDNGGGTDTSAPQTFTITVTAVNDAPVAVGDAYTIAEDTVLTVDTSAFNGLQALLFNDSDVDAGTTLTAVYLTNPTNGTLLPHANGSFSYTPNAGYFGPDSFTYQAHDGTLSSNIVTVNLTVTSVNDPPSFTKGANQAVTPDTAHTVSGWATAISAGPANESAQAVDFLVSNDNSALFATQPTVAPNGTLTFASKINKTGVATVTVRAHDNGGTANGGIDTSAPQTFTITVTLGPIPPDAVNDSATTSEDTDADIAVLANDSDANGDALTVTSVTAPAHGSATINADQTIKYTPSLHFSGEDSFSYTISDGLGGSDTAVVTVTVTPVNDAPTAVNDTATASSGSPARINVVGNDTDPDNSAAGALIASETFTPAGAASNIAFANEIARVASTGYLYVAGGRGIAVVNPATNAIVGTIDLSRVGTGGASFHQVNDATSIVYFRHAPNWITAIDGRAGSETFNQVLARFQIGGNVQAFAIDQAKGLLYVTNTTGGSGTAFQGRISVVDIDPLHGGTFHQVIGEVTFPSNIRGIIADSANDRVYAAADGGLIRIDNASTPARVVTTPSTGGLLDIVLLGRVYGYGGAGTGTTRLVAYDPASGVVSSFTLANFTPGFTAGKRFVAHAASGRLFLRSSGQVGSAGKVVVLDGNLADWATNPVLAEITAVGRDSVSDMVVDQSRNLVIATSLTDNQVAFIDANAPAASINGTVQVQALPVGGEAELDEASGQLYLAHLAMVQRMTVVSPRAVLSPVVVGAESGFAVALPGPLGAPNTDRFFIGRTGLGMSVRKYTIGGTASNLTLAHDIGRAVFLGANQQTNRLYVLNSNANATGLASTPSSVSVVDGATGGLIATVDVGHSAFGIGVNETTNKIYVGNGGNALLNGGISVIDGASNTVTPANISAVFPVNTLFGRHLEPLCIGPACGTANKVFVQANKQNGVISVAVLNGSTNAVTELSAAAGVTNANLIRATSALNRVFIGNQTDQTTHDVVVINGTTEAKLTTLRGVSSQSNAFVTQQYLAVDASRQRIYSADFLSDRLYVLNAAIESGCDAGQLAPAMACYPIIASIATGDGPTGVAIDTAANRIYVTNALAKSLTIIDGATLKVAGTVAVPLVPTTLALDTSSPAITYVFASGSIGEPGAMLISDNHGGGTLAVVAASLTQPASGTTTVAADGTVEYVSTAGFTGVDTFKYRVSDGVATSANEATVTVTVGAPLTITTTALAGGIKDQPYSQPFGATGGTPPYNWVMNGQLPGGLAANPAGSIAGTPSQSGTFPITAIVRDSASPPQVALQNYTLIVGPMVIATTFLPSGFVGTPYNQQLLAGGTADEVTWTLNTNGHPALSWLSLSTDGVLSGTPTTYGTTPSFTVTAMAGGQVASRGLTLFVNAPLDVAAPREGIVLETQPGLSIIGGNGTRTVTKTAGTLPPGLTLHATNGSFTGSPTRHGSFDFTVEIRDCNPASTCPSGTTQQVVSKNLTLRVSAKDQQGSSQGGGLAFGFGGPGGRKVAQVITVGAQGSLTAVGLTSQTFSCPSGTPVLIEVQRLALNGLPDGVTISDGVATTNYGAISVTPEIGVAIDERLAFIVSSPLACTFTNASTFDQYNAGDAYVDAGGGWQRLFDTDGRYDLPSFRTLIQPAMDVAYLNRSRGALTATLLNTGKVLLVSNQSASELYDPATHTSALTANTLAVQRSNHTATLLADGTVLIVGGNTTTGTRTTLAEIFDPVTGLFTPITTAGGQLGLGRDRHQAVLLGNGKVLIIGGQTDTGSRTATTEIYDPATQTFSPSGDMSIGREQFTATLLPSGKVLVTGGYTNCCGGSHAELFDPGTGSFTAAGNMIVSNRGQSTATLLADGKVLIAGGQSGDIRKEAELYDPATNTFTATGSLGGKRYIHTATPLADGSVLVAGGFDQQSSSSYILPLATLERYVPGSGTFVPAGGMETRRQALAAVRLPNDKVFLAGGFSQSWMTGNTGELYDPAAALTLAPTTLPDAALNTPYAVSLTAGGGGGPPYEITHVSGALPAGMQYDFPTATLSGTPGPASTGVYPLGFDVSDAASNRAVQTRTLRVGSINTITSPYRLPDAALTQPYSVQLAATGAAPIAWSLLPAASTVPPGITLSSGGLLSGTPTQFNYFNFGVRAIDANGVEATKILSISVQNPLTITTTSLNNGDLFGGGFGCISTQNGQGTRTYSISGGTPPAGLTLGPTNSCFTGTLRETGTFTFTVQVTDQSAPPQVATREYTVNVWAQDQNTGFQSNQPDLTFGGSIRLGQRIITGITGTLRAIRVNGITCTAGATVTAEIQGLTPAGAPDGNSFDIGSAVAPFGSIVLSLGEFYAADAQFALVLSATNTCAVKPSTFDNYPGDGFYDDGGGAWQRLQTSPDGRYDIPFTTLITPADGLVLMNTWRGAHTATVLQCPVGNPGCPYNGHVLLAGGNTQTAEIYNPNDGSITPTGSMSTSRRDFQATALDDGTVLVTGGSYWNGSSTVYLGTAELFHPDTGMFELLPATMSSARAYHTATPLADGRVLIAGGQSGPCCGPTDLSSAEFYNPGPQTFTSAGAMNKTRRQHTATLLTDDRVLLAGGWGSGSNTVEIFDPFMSSYTVSTQFMSTRSQHTATRLTCPIDNPGCAWDGQVLLTGGAGNFGAALNDAVLFDPVGETFTPAGTMSSPRVNHATSLLGDGSVLVTGGQFDNVCCDPHPPQASMDRFVPGSGFTSAGSMLAARNHHAATLLSNGQVLLAGTFGWSSAAGRTAEIYDPSSAPAFTTTQASGASGSPFAFTLTPTGGAGGPYTITHLSGALPGGVSFNQATGEFSGPVNQNQSGTFHLSIQLTDGGGHSTYHTIVLRIDPLDITTASLPIAYQGVEYDGVLSATGVGALTWSLVPFTGSLPPALTLNADGTITGATTSSCCTNSFTVRVTDSIGQTATKTLSISVQQPLTINTVSLADGTAGNTYGGCLGTSGGNGQRTWSLSGQIPIGLKIQENNGCFDGSWPTGVIRQAGTFTFTVHVTDSSVPAQSDAQDFTIKIHAQDQSMGGDFGQPNIALPPTRRIAQVYRASSPFPLSGLQLHQYVTCSAATQFTIDVFPVTGNPPRPDDGGPPLGSAVVTTNANGFFNWIIAFPQPIAIPQGSSFAVVLSFTDDACAGRDWSVFNDYYRLGRAWIDDGAGWTLASTAISRNDIPFATLVMPPSSLRFFAGWRGGQAMAPILSVPEDDRLLIVGGDQSAEIYDPSANTITHTANMSVQRHQPTATRLTTGKVLIVGGSYWVNNQQTAADTTEIFEAATGQFTPSQPNIALARFGHRATRLSDGRVLVTGGWTRDGNNQPTLNTALLFAADGSSFVTLTMTGARVRHSATLLNDGRVLIVGGWTGDPWPNTVAEIYDPNNGPNGAFSPIAAGYNRWPSQHTATLLATGPRAGQVLIAGGSGGPFPELDGTGTYFDPVTMSFTEGPELLVPRFEHTATTLGDGRIVFAGGVSDWFNHVATTTLEMFDPMTDHASILGDLSTDRQAHDTEFISLGEGAALAVSGGWGSSALSGKTIEIVDFSNALSALKITTTTLPDGVTGGDYGANLTAAGGIGPDYTFTIVWGSLPPGLSLAPNGALGGDPTAGGVYGFTVRVRDSASNEAFRSFTITVDRLVITSTSPLPPGTINTNYSHQLTAAGGVGAVTWSVQPWVILPGDIALSGTGLLSGMAPETPGNFWIDVVATDSIGQVATKNLNVQFNTPLAIQTQALGDAIAGNTYGGCIAFNGGAGPFTWSLSGDVPDGLAINNNGCFDGAWPERVLRKGGAFDFTVQVVDSSVPSQQDAQPLTLTIHAQDQQASSDFSTPSVLLPATRRVAQIFQSSSPFTLSGIQLFNQLTCGPNAQFTVTVRPATGTPLRPDESGVPLGSITVTTDGGGFFNWTLAFPQPIAIPQGSSFAIVLSFAQECSGDHWPINDWYRRGDAWVDDGGNWTLASSAIGRYDIPMGTLVLPSAGSNAPRFFSSWRGGLATATLGDGRVLLVGEDNTIEIFDPATRTLTHTATMAVTRHQPTATRLQNGSVLIVGGSHWDGNAQQASVSTQIYNPAAGTLANGPAMPVGRFGHEATLLGNGKVLITGGWTVDINGNQQILSSALLFAADGSSFVPLAMTGPRAKHTATHVGGNRVLLIGGWTSNPSPTVAEIYDPTAGPDGAFVEFANTLTTWPTQHTASLLTAGPRLGDVLIAGGSMGAFPTLDPAGTFLDPDTGAASAGPSLALARFDHSATTLDDGRIVFAGGIANWEEHSPTSVVEMYDPWSNTSAIVGDLITERQAQQADVVIEGGVTKLAVSGGWGSGSLASRTIEIFDFDAQALTITTTALPVGSTTAAYTATLTATGGSGAGYEFYVAWGNLPSGLTLAPNGDISGDPDTAGVFAFAARVKDSSNNLVYRDLTITIDKLQITSDSTLPPAVAGARYTHQLTASGTGAITWSLEPFSTLPGTITLSASGLLDGTAPNVDQWFGFTVRVRDASGQFAIKGFSLQIAAASNNAPTATDDYATTTTGTAVVISVLDNDTDPDIPMGDALTVIDVTQGSNGTVSIETDNKVTYTPLGSYGGPDSFTYTIRDSAGATATATVRVSVERLLNNGFDDGLQGWIVTGSCAGETRALTDDAIHGGVLGLYLSGGGSCSETLAYQVALVDIDAQTSMRLRLDVKMMQFAGLYTGPVYLQLSSGTAPSYSQVSIGSHKFSSGALAENFALVGTTSIPVGTWYSWTSDDLRSLFPPGTTAIRVALRVPGQGVFGWAKIDNVKVITDDAAVVGATIQANPSSGNSPLAVSFVGTATHPDGVIANTWWDFGNGSIDTNAMTGGSTANTLSPSFTFSGSRTYAVSLIAEDDFGATRTAMTNIVTANPPPAVSIGASPHTGPAPLMVNFTGNASDVNSSIVSYVWTFGDGGTSNQQNPTHTFANAGSYNVTFTATDDQGAASTSTFVIVATDAALAAGELSNGDFGAGLQGWMLAGNCAGETLARNDDSAHGGTLGLSLSGGGSCSPTTVSQVVLVDADSATSVRVRLDVKMMQFAGFYTGPVRLKVYRGQAPTYDEALLGEHVFAPGALAENFALSGTTALPVGTWYAWTSNDLKLLLPPGTTALRLVFYVPGGGVFGWARIDNVRLVLNNTAVPSLSASASPNPAGFGSPIGFSGSALDDDGVTKQAWDFGDGSRDYFSSTGGTTSFSAAPSFTYPGSGTFYASWTAEDALGGASTQIVPVTVNPNQLPSASISATPESGVAPLDVQFSATVSDPDGFVTAYSWSFGDGTALSSDVAPTHQYALSGSYLVKLTVTDNAGGTGVTQFVMVVTGPHGIANKNFGNGLQGWMVAGTCAGETQARTDDAVHGGTLGLSLSGGGSCSPTTVSQVALVDADSATSVRVRLDVKMMQFAGLYTGPVRLKVFAGTAPAYDQTLLGEHVFAPGAPAENFALSGTTTLPLATWYAWTSNDLKPLLPPGTSAVRLVFYVPGGGVFGWARIDNVQLVLDDATMPATTASASATNGALPLTVDFSGTALDDDGSVAANWWDFGNGTSDQATNGGGATSNDANASFTYTAAGNLYASWTAEDDRGAARTSLVNVQPGNTPPQAIINANPNSGPAPLMVQFNGTGSSDPDGVITSYLWTFGDGSPTSTASTVQHTFNAPGSYLVTLKVTDNFGATHTDQLVVVVQ